MEELDILRMENSRLRKENGELVERLSKWSVYVEEMAHMLTFLQNSDLTGAALRQCSILPKPPEGMSRLREALR